MFSYMITETPVHLEKHCQRDNIKEYSSSVWATPSVTWCDFWGCSLQVQELDSVILVGLF